MVATRATSTTATKSAAKAKTRAAARVVTSAATKVTATALSRKKSYSGKTWVVKEGMLDFVNVPVIAQKPCLREKWTKRISKRIKMSTKVGCYKDSCIEHGNGFSSASENDVEFVPEVEVTANVAEKYWIN